MNELAIPWIRLTERMPSENEHNRVLIFAPGVDLDGEEIFDVRSEELNECFFSREEDQPEVCRRATHWMPLPTPPDEDLR